MVNLWLMVIDDVESIPGCWLCTYPSEKKQWRLESLLPIDGKIEHVPNHQPVWRFVILNSLKAYPPLIKHDNGK